MWDGERLMGRSLSQGYTVALPLAVLTGSCGHTGCRLWELGPHPDTVGVEPCGRPRQACLSGLASRSVDSSALVQEAVRSRRGGAPGCL